MQVYSKIGKGPADSQEAAAGMKDMPDTRQRKYKVINDMMDYQLENLILHYVTEEDLTEVARTWPADHHPLSDTGAGEGIVYLRLNYGRKTKGCIFHLCMAVC